MIKSILVDVQNKIMQEAVSWREGNVVCSNLTLMAGNIFFHDFTLMAQRKDVFNTSID